LAREQKRDEKRNEKRRYYTSAPFDGRKIVREKKRRESWKES
jgi:hypothetical protein